MKIVFIAFVIVIYIFWILRKFGIFKLKSISIDEPKTPGDKGELLAGRRVYVVQNFSIGWKLLDYECQVVSFRGGNLRYIQKILTKHK